MGWNEEFNAALTRLRETRARLFESRREYQRPQPQPISQSNRENP